MSLEKYLIDWVPEIVKATPEDLARFGQQAARVRALLNYTSNSSTESAIASTDSWLAHAFGNDDFQPAWKAAMDEVNASAANPLDNFDISEPLRAADSIADSALRERFNVERFNVGRHSPFPLGSAIRAELVSDRISPEAYRYLTGPVNTGRVLDQRAGLLLPGQQGQFLQMVKQLSPASPEDILAIERLSGNPNVDALLEMLGAMSGSQPLARKINAVETLWRSGRGGRGMQ